MVVVDLLLSVFFYLASLTGLAGLLLGNDVMIIISLVIMGLAIIVLAVAAFTVDLLVLRIVTCSLTVLIVVGGILIGSLGNLGTLNGMYFSMLISWVFSSVMLGIVDCYDDMDGLISTVMRKTAPGVLLIFGAAGMTFQTDWAIITAAVGFAILCIVLMIVAVANDYHCLRPCLTAIGLSLIVSVILGFILYFAAGVVWWHSLIIFMGLCYLSIYVASTAVSGETDGMAERVSDIGELFF